MNKIEAIKALLEGKKVYAVGFTNCRYFLLCHGYFVNDRGEEVDFNHYLSCSIWELYQEPNKMVKKKFTRWVNYYSDNPSNPLGNFFNSEADAVKFKTDSVIPFKVEFEIEVTNE